MKVKIERIFLMTIDIKEMTEPFIMVSNLTHCRQMLSTIDRTITIDKPKGNLTIETHNDTNYEFKTHVSVEFNFVYPFKGHYGLICQIKAMIDINKHADKITQDDFRRIVQPVLDRASQVSYNLTNEILGYPIKCEFSINKLYRRQ